MKDFLPLETDTSHIGQGYRLPVLGIKVDLLDLLFIAFNVAAFLICVGYTAYRKLNAFRPRKLEVEVSSALEVPFFHKGHRKAKSGKESKEYTLEFRCEKCPYHHETLAKYLS